MLKVLGFAVIGASVLVLAGCSGALTSSFTSSEQEPLVYQRSGSLKSCQQALSQENAQLQATKQKAHKAHVAITWDQSDGLITDAAEAEDHQDYTMCLLKAQEVGNCVQREQNYIEWKGSLKSSSWI